MYASSLKAGTNVKVQNVKYCVHFWDYMGTPYMLWINTTSISVHVYIIICLNNSVHAGIFDCCLICMVCCILIFPRWQLSSLCWGHQCEMLPRSFRIHTQVHLTCRWPPSNLHLTYFKRALNSQTFGNVKPVWCEQKPIETHPNSDAHSAQSRYWTNNKVCRQDFSRHLLTLVD